MKDRSTSWDVLFALALAALATAQLWPGLSAGLAPPISWDHGSHLGKAILTWDMLPSLRGWTDLIENGVPLNTVYTATGTLLILFVRVFTQHLAWTQTYALTVVLFRMLVALSVYRLARVLKAGTVGSLLAGVMYLADFGDHSEGGWFYEVLYGVWPMSLAMGIFFVGLADLLEFLDEGQRKHGFRAMLLLGVALFSHQATLLAIGSVLPALVLARMTTTQVDLRRDVRRLVLVLSVAGLVSLWWLLPMFGFTAWLDDHGQLYHSTEDIGHRFLTGEGILRGGPFTSVLTAIGLGYGLFTGDSRRRGLAGAALVAMVIASPGWLLGLDVVRYLPSVGRIVFPRMMTIAKPIAFALAGAALGDLLTRLGRSQERWLRSTRGKVGLALVLAALAPFVLRADDALRSTLLERDVPTTATVAEWSSWQDSWRWIRQRRAEGPDEGFYRVFWLHEGTHLGQASPAFTGVPGHVTGVLVGEAFRNTSDGTHPDALRAMNVRYVVAFQDLPHALRGETTLVTTLGAARIYELSRWSSETVSDLVGSIHPEVEHYEDDRVVFRPNGATRVVVRRAYAPPMHAYADGREIPIELERVPDSPHLRLMRLEVPTGTERVEVRYAGLGARGWLGWLGTLLGLVLSLAYLYEERLPAPVRSARGLALARLQATFERIPEGPRTFLVEHWAHLALLLPVLGLALLVLRAGRGYHVANHLDAVVLEHRATPGGPAAPCTGGEGNCLEAGALHLERQANCVDGWFRSCISAGPPSRGTLVVRAPEAPTRGTVELGGGVHDDAFGRGEGAPITIRTYAGEQLLGTLEIPYGRHWESARYELDGQGELRFELDGGAPGRRMFCFDAIVR
jgi:hypothetical protein